MYCASCGAELQQGAAFCSTCGNRVGVAAAPRAVESATPSLSTQRRPGALSALLAAIKGVTYLYVVVGLLWLLPTFREGFLGGAGNPNPEAVVGGAILVYPVLVLVAWFIAWVLSRS